ncbi:unnamed protein product [Cochlearia groenlandica]
MHTPFLDRFIVMSSKIKSAKQEELTLCNVTNAIEDECLDNKKQVLEMCLKRKRLCKEDVLEEEDNDGFKTPTRQENKIPKVKECPPAPEKIRPENSMMFKGKTCRRKLTFSLSPVDNLRSFITDLQWRTTTMTIKK